MRPSGVLQEFLVTLTRMTLHIEEKLLWKLLQFSNFHKMTTELDALNDDENSYNSQRWDNECRRILRQFRDDVKMHLQFSVIDCGVLEQFWGSATLSNNHYDI